MNLMMLAFRPFLDPVTFDGPWLVLAIPLVLGVCVVYKAIKLEDLSELFHQSLLMAAQVVLMMTIAAIVLWSVCLLM